MCPVCERERKPFTHTMQHLSNDLLVLISEKLLIVEALTLVRVSRNLNKALSIDIKGRPELLGKRVLDTFLAKALAYFQERFHAQTFECKITYRTTRFVCLDNLQAPCFYYAITSPANKLFVLRTDVVLHSKSSHTIGGELYDRPSHYMFSFHFKDEERGTMSYFDFGSTYADSEAAYTEGGPWTIFKTICCPTV